MSRRRTLRRKINRVYAPAQVLQMFDEMDRKPAQKAVDRAAEWFTIKEPSNREFKFQRSNGTGVNLKLDGEAFETPELDDPAEYQPVGGRWQA